MNDWDSLINCNDIFRIKKPKHNNDDSIVVHNKKPVYVACESIYEQDDEDNCFGCMYIGEYDMGAIRNEDLKALMDRQRKSIGKVNPRSLARDLAERYAIMQERYNSKLRPGQQPLPDYGPEKWMNHWLYHNVDPELQGWLRMWEMQKIAQKSLKASFIMNADTGEECIDEKQNKIYNDTCKNI